MVIKAIFFDLFGTLLVYSDFDSSHSIWTETFHKRIGKPNGLSSAETASICNKILIDTVQKEIGLTTYETKIKQNFQRFKIEIPPSELRSIADESISNWQNSIKLADDTIEVLSCLQQNYKLCLISNFDHSPHVRRILKKYKLEMYFDKIIISDEVDCIKPDPKIFRIALDYFILKATEVVHIGDNPIDDIEGALSAGIMPILIDRNQKTYIDQRNSQKDGIGIIHSLSEIAERISITCC
jgi:putative hydrolase of the HAD superfamily